MFQNFAYHERIFILCHGFFCSYFVTLKVTKKRFSFFYQIFETRNVKEIHNSKPKIYSLSGDVTIFDASPFFITQFLKKRRFEIRHTRFENFYLNGYYFGRSTFKLRIPEFWENTGLSGTLRL